MSQKHRTKGRFFQAFIAMLLAIAGTFLVYVIVGFIFIDTQGTDFGGFSKELRNNIAKLFIAVAFPLFFHFLYTKERNKIYSQYGINIDKPFDIKRELLVYIKQDGVPFLIVCGVFAVIQGILYTIYFFSGIRNPLFVVFLFVFPFQPDTVTSWSQYIVSLLSPFFNLIFSFPYILFLAVLSRKRMYKKIKGVL